MAEPRHIDGLLPRRTALRAGLSVGLAGLLLPAATGCTRKDRQDRITVAGGETGGFYLEFATLLAGLLQRNGVAVTAVPLTTGGSLENLELVESGEATFAIALADAAAQRANPQATGTLQASGARQAPQTAPGTIAAVGKVYENYVHCIVRRDSGIGTLADLADGPPHHCRFWPLDGVRRRPGHPGGEPGAQRWTRRPAGGISGCAVLVRRRSHGRHRRRQPGGGAGVP
jgi:hypothetical protein